MRIKSCRPSVVVIMSRGITCMLCCACFCTHIHIVILRTTFMFTRVALADFISHMTIVTSNFVCRFVAPVSLGSCNNQSAITQSSFHLMCFRFSNLSIFTSVIHSIHFCQSVFTSICDFRLFHVLHLIKQLSSHFTMASSELDSKAEFARRAQVLGVGDTLLQSIKDAGLDTYGRFAPRGFKQINIAQLIAADKRLWILMSEQSKGNVSAKPPADKPCDALLKHISSSPEVLNFLSPQPDIPDKASLRYDPYHPKPPKPGKGKGKDGKGSGPSDAGQPLPEGCTLKKSDGKPICGFFNRGKCWHKVKAGKRCPRGLHICWKSGCHREKPAYECTHTD